MKKINLVSSMSSVLVAVVAVACSSKQPVRSVVIAPTVQDEKGAPKAEELKSAPESPKVDAPVTPVLSNPTQGKENPTQGKDVFDAAKVETAIAVVAPSVNGKWEFAGYSCANNVKPTKVAEFENMLLKSGLPVSASLFTGAAANGQEPFIKRNFTWDILVGERNVSFRKTHLSVKTLTKSGFANIDKRITITESAPGKLTLVHNKIESVSLSNSSGGNAIDIAPAIDFIAGKLNEVMKDQTANSVYASLPKQAQDFLTWIQSQLSSNQQAVKAAGDLMQSLVSAVEVVDYSVNADTLTMTNSRVTFKNPLTGQDINTDRVDDLVCGLNGVAVRTYNRVK